MGLNLGGADPLPALNDDERLALDRLGPETWWRWVRRGQWDPPQSWEVEG